MKINTTNSSTMFGSSLLFAVVISYLTLSSCNVMEQGYSRGIPQEYMKSRHNLLNAEAKLRLGGSLAFYPEEKIVDTILLKEKRVLMETSRLNRTIYQSSRSFFYSKSFMESTNIFKIIQQMPKGAILHTHDLSSASLDWLIKNVTYRENLYFCRNDEGYLIFKFCKQLPQKPVCRWRTVKAARDEMIDIKAFDLHLKRNLSLLVSDPLKTYVDDNAVWDRFTKFFQQVKGMVYYAPVFRDYYRQVLTECLDDNVQYLEMRAQLFGLFDLEGNEMDAQFGLSILQSVTQNFVKEHPDFLGAKFIMVGMRHDNKSRILDGVKTAMKLHAKYPNSMIGYDLVGHEPCYHSLLYYIDDLLYPSLQKPPFKLPYFLHAGETAWQGTDVDYNLADAILLNATRIGHGYALDKHPLLAKLVKERGIAVEVNPISNQILRLVDDLRNHPMVPLMSSDFPVVISSDDHGSWESLPLTHDFYVAFMDMSGEDTGLSFLKQLAINSLKYSVLTAEERKAAIKLWKAKWDKFIKQIVTEQYDVFHQ